jgi:hypothetical protein
MCESGLMSPFVAAKVCPTEASTEYDNAEFATNRKRLSSPKEFGLLSLSRLNKSFHRLWIGSLLNLLKRWFLRQLKRMYMLFPFHPLKRGY